MSERLSDTDRGILAIIRYNKLTKRTEIVKQWQLGRTQITFEWRSRCNLWGRFGGGWNWNLGLQASRSTTIISLLIFSLRFDRIKKEHGGEDG